MSNRPEVDTIPAPCHPNPSAVSDVTTLRTRGDVRHLPKPLQDRLARLAGRPHTALPIQAYAEADLPSQRAWLLTGTANTVSPAVPASAGRDGDDR